MKVKDIIKKQTTVIAIAVALVAVTVIGVSYAIFFDVKKNTDNQIITAGTLQFSVTGVNALDISEPIDDVTGLSSSPVSYTAKNTDSNLPASYKIYIYADTANTVEINKIKISTDGNVTKGNTAKNLSSITPETINGKSCYKIDEGTVAAGNSGTTKYLRLWIDEDSITGDITNKNIDLKMYYVSEVQE